MVSLDEEKGILSIQLSIEDIRFHIKLMEKECGAIFKKKLTDKECLMVLKAMVKTEKDKNEGAFTGLISTYNLVVSTIYYMFPSRIVYDPAQYVKPKRYPKIGVRMNG